MLRQCNVLNMVEVWLDRYRTGHVCEQDCRTVRKACANQMTTVWCCRNDKEAHTVSGLATDSSGTKAEQVTKTPQKCVQGKRSTDLRLVLEPDGWMTW